MPDTIDKRAEELYAVIFADWRSDIERIQLIAAALRKERQEAADAAADWLIGSSLYFMPEEIDARSDDIEALRAAILKED